MRMHVPWDMRVWSEDMPLGGGEPGMGDGSDFPPYKGERLGPDRVREVEGGINVGAQSDPGKFSDHVSYVNEPPPHLIGKVDGDRPASLIEGGEYSVGPASESGADTGPSGGELADGASNTGGVADWMGDAGGR